LQAVRYRYRLCTECSEEFKALLANPSETWQAGWGDEELMYKLERCIYVFFMSGLSVFESFALASTSSLAPSVLMPFLTSASPGTSHYALQARPLPQHFPKRQ